MVQPGTDLAGDVMSIKMKTTDMLVDPGKWVKLLDGTLCCLHHFAWHTLRPPRDVLNPRGLQHEPMIKLYPSGCSSAFSH